MSGRISSADDMIKTALEQLDMIGGSPGDGILDRQPDRQCAPDHNPD